MITLLLSLLKQIVLWLLFIKLLILLIVATVFINLYKSFVGPMLEYGNSYHLGPILHT